MKDRRLSKTAQRILRSGDDQLVFSLVSLWEISIKIKLGKLNAIGSSVSYLRDEMDAFGMELLPIRYEHVLHLETLPPLHRDPFDRLMIAQSLFEGLPILTEDRQFKDYGVKVIW